MNPDLPTHLVSRLLLDADLAIDTRRELRMRPGPVGRLLSTDARSKLAGLFDLRSRTYARFVQLKKAGGGACSALGGCDSPLIPQSSPRESLSISLSVWDIDGRVLMQFEKTLLVEPRPGSRLEHLGGVAYNRGSVHCDVQTGELVPRFLDEDTDSEEVEDMEFDM